MKAYIATTLTNIAKHNEVRDALKELDVDITYDWTAHGPVWEGGEDRVRQVSIAELNGVNEADIVIVILPGGRGTHAELGMAIALNKRIIILSENDSTLYKFFECNENTCAFYHYPSVVWCRSIECIKEFICGY